MRCRVCTHCGFQLRLADFTHHASCRTCGMTYFATIDSPKGLDNFPYRNIRQAKNSLEGHYGESIRAALANIAEVKSNIGGN